MQNNQLFSFLLNNVFVAASKLYTKSNKTGFTLYASNSPPDFISRVNQHPNLFNLPPKF
jgi:hypothetical protein